ncbi:DUF362 domain-containing protein [candidate division KSB1 bacterium]|nr:DUF362 domain-containing protein [candidate division KSB1 bacterium]
MKSRVAVIRCNGYDTEKVEKAIQTGIELLGGISAFADKGETLLLKPNVLSGVAPQKHVTTHPAVFKAVAVAMQKADIKLQYGDSPAVGKYSGALKRAGVSDVAEELGISLADFEQGRDIFYKEGRQNKSFSIANGVLQCDGLISLAKLKTHGFQKYTGCIKNQFGCIPGLRKSEFHFKLTDAFDFARMLVDLDRFIRPRLYIMDAITGMEGNGPQNGSPAEMNVLLFSTDPVALDATACRMIELDPLRVPVIRVAAEAGIGAHAQKDIELSGDSLPSYPDFDVDRKPLRPYRTKGIRQFLSQIITLKPVIRRERCIKCGKCVEVCPTDPKAVDWPQKNHGQPPQHDYKLCIRCYCCQEVCPEDAIGLKKPLMRKIIDGLIFK